jgi:hypothetical protein
MDKIKSSPQFSNRDVDWDKYAERWNIKGDFTQAKVSPEQLKKLINSQWLSMVQNVKIDDADVQKKINSGKRNAIIISQRPGGQMVVVDGNHSLVAAARSGDKSVDVIFPKGREKDFGVNADAPTDSPTVKPQGGAGRGEGSARRPGDTG